MGEISATELQIHRMCDYSTITQDPVVKIVLAMRTYSLKKMMFSNFIREHGNMPSEFSEILFKDFFKYLDPTNGTCASKLQTHKDSVLRFFIDITDDVGEDLTRIYRDNKETIKDFVEECYQKITEDGTIIEEMSNQMISEKLTREFIKIKIEETMPKLMGLNRNKNYELYKSRIFIALINYKFVNIDDEIVSKFKKSVGEPSANLKKKMLWENVLFYVTKNYYDEFLKRSGNSGGGSFRKKSRKKRSIKKKKKTNRKHLKPTRRK